MSFTISLKKLTDKMGNNADIVVKKVAIDVLSSVIKKSPVDTGRFKGNWQLAVGNVNSLVDEDAKDSTPLKTSSGAKEVEAGITLSGFRSGKTIFISNSLPYAQRLENGYSGQAPAGMVRLTVIDFKRGIRKARL